VSRRLGLLAPGALLAAGCAFLIAGAWIPVKADLAQQLLDRAWTATVEGSAGQRAPQRPWPWADTWPVARLTLPTSGRALTVLAGASGRNLAFGPALMDGSAPLGAPGVSVIAGHRDTHFSALGKLSIGDRFTLELPTRATLVYEIIDIDVVDATRAALRLDGEESVVALVTCYPFDAVAPGGSLRYVVTARRVREYPPDPERLATFAGR